MDSDEGCWEMPDLTKKPDIHAPAGTHLMVCIAGRVIGKTYKVNSAKIILTFRMLGGEGIALRYYNAKREGCRWVIPSRSKWATEIGSQFGLGEKVPPERAIGLRMMCDVWVPGNGVPSRIRSCTIPTLAAVDSQ
jgi:hypothetical protein